jgi:hypothetical protein
MASIVLWRVSAMRHRNGTKRGGRVLGGALMAPIAPWRMNIRRLALLQHQASLGRMAAVVASVVAVGRRRGFSRRCGPSLRLLAVGDLKFFDSSIERLSTASKPQRRLPPPPMPPPPPQRLPPAASTTRFATAANASSTMPLRRREQAPWR